MSYPAYRPGKTWHPFRKGGMTVNRIVSSAAALLLALALGGCSRAPVPLPPMVLPVTTSPAAAVIPASAAGPADTERLLRCLESAAELQPCSAGSSLRLASVGAELLGWLEDNPAGAEEGEAAVRAWAWGAAPDKLRSIAGTLRLLKEAAGTMEACELRALLWDAGCVLPEHCPSREEFLTFLERLNRTMETAIFSQNLRGMNIFRLNRCRPDKLVL